MNEKQPLVGIAVIVMREDKTILLGKRKGSHGAGKLSFPGGKLGQFENIRACGMREVLEETGLTELNIELIEGVCHPVTEDFFFEEDLHYITHYLRAKYNSGTPMVREPNKCGGWDWFPWNRLPNRQHLFLPIKNLLRQNYDPFEGLGR